MEAELITCKEELEYALEQLAMIEAEKTKLEEHLAEMKENKEEDFTEIAGHPPLNNTPDSVIFHETIFTKHLNEYYVAGRGINKGFWSYWHAQGREGKQVMRDAGWRLEKVNNNWEVTISPKDFQAWIENKGLTVEPTSPFHERVVQPILSFLADEKEHRRIEIINLLAERFSLNQAIRSDLSNSGRIEKYLMSKGLIERTRTGYYKITTHGLEVVEDIPF